MKNYIIYFIILLLATYSCEDDIKLNLNPDSPVMVVNALAGNDSLVRVHVSLSKQLHNNNNNNNNNNVQTTLADATLSIYEEGKLLGKLKKTEDAWYEIQSRFQADLNYRVEVNHPKYKSISAETRIPSEVKISHCEMTKNETAYHFQLQFQDKSYSKDYYMILLYAVTNEVINGENYQQNSLLSYYSEDIIFKDNLLENTTNLDQNLLRGSLGFSDHNKSGEKFDIKFYAPIQVPPYEIKVFKVKLLHISRDYFAYERSKRMISNREDMPIYKKINLHSNINGGAGIFAGYTLNEWEITD
ncbi:DUF4249 domain-containing protein [Ancylomarina euxinus]|uniref:DUF4249 domain-containing protein n=1 Tax=Ancylomarina euxinus TaxID=2283627 RepID=A0A425Y045_9BACT|nr:DUF4249 domain-containing protein [Ancylomarina euxinus]MCZ4695202.1 DUF4249 domain-containing protein [Ancylomarina euxinus]MUP15399.1 DUF4249 family protein [Ancylomarina euxinus]RRG21109.1 DUF4249 domain-containing protein [Ancylomarina euxinus]